MSSQLLESPLGLADVVGLGIKVDGEDWVAKAKAYGRGMREQQIAVVAVPLLPSGCDRAFLSADRDEMWSYLWQLQQTLAIRGGYVLV